MKFKTNNIRYLIYGECIHVKTIWFSTRVGGRKEGEEEGKEERDGVGEGGGKVEERRS